jgi:hypothetical protein
MRIRHGGSGVKRTMAAAFLVHALAVASPGGPPGIAGEAPEGTIPKFAFKACPIALSGPARPGTYFDKVGRKFAVLGTEDGVFEAWAWPLKLFREFRLSFLLGTSTVPVEARDVARFFEATPSRSTVTYVHQAFTIRAHFVADIAEAGAVILLEVDAAEPLTVVASFLPVLAPMWPAGLGGQSARWDEALKAYVISEPTRRAHALAGALSAKGITYAPAHMLSDAPSQFSIAVDHPGRFRGRYIPIVMAGGKGDRDSVVAVYRKLMDDPEGAYRAAEEHYDRLLATTLRVQTPAPELDLAFVWAKLSYDGLVADNPDLGRGLVAGLGLSGTGGRPGFGWYFGGDAYINALSLTGLGCSGTAREAIAFTRKWQRPDGKMAHELTQAAGDVDWWKDYPYGFIHADTTPFYIVAVDDYHAATGDLPFVRESWESLKKAYAWCVSTDADGDGLMDNDKAGLGALEYGSLTGIRTDIYLAAVWARACEAMGRLAGAAGDISMQRKAMAARARAGEAFRAKFWDAGTGHYAYAVDEKGGLVGELTPWSSVGLLWGLGGAEETASTLERLAGAELTTAWGVRTISSRSSFYEPLNYNYGAVWPFLTGWAAAAHFRNDRPVPGYLALASAARHMFDNALGAATEVFSGDRNIWPAEAVPHQGFSAGGVVLPFVRGLLGLDGNAAEGRMRFAPAVPADWGSVDIENFAVGGARADIRYRRLEGRVLADVSSSAPEGWRLEFRPSFGPGTKILSASVNGMPAGVRDGGPGTDAVRPSVDFPLTGRDTVEIVFVPAVEILPPPASTRTGDADTDLKVIRVRSLGADQGLEVVVEGRAGVAYEIPVAGSERIASVEGAVRQGARLSFRLPGAAGEAFARQRIVVRIKPA